MFYAFLTVTIAFALILLPILPVIGGKCDAKKAICTAIYPRSDLLC